MANIKYKANFHVFDTIDTEEKAYWLGFVWCDGYVNDRRPQGRYEISIKLQLASYDEPHLEKFKKFLESDFKIAQYKHKSFGKEHFTSRLMFSNKHMGETLLDKYGMVPNRSCIKKLKRAIPDDLMQHFIRGVFDAEGNMTVYYNKGIQLKSLWRITTYKELVMWIQDYLLENNLVLSKTKLDKRHDDRDAETVNFSVCGNQQIKNLTEWLYKDANIYLNRKKEKHLELLNIMNERGLTNV